MAGTPSPQTEQETPSQPSIHPMASGGGSIPIMPMQSMSRMPSARPKENLVKLTNFSLLAIIASLMFLGAFTFLGGLLTGLWLSSSSNSISPQQGYSTQSYPVAPNTAVPSVDGGQRGILSAVEQELGESTSRTLGSQNIPGVPHVLSSAVNTLQIGEARQAGRKITETLHGATRNLIPPRAPVPSGRPPMAPPRAASSTTGIQPSSASPFHSAATLHPAHEETATASALAKETSDATADEKDIHAVQLGVFASKENAETLASHLQTLSYNPQVKEGKAPDGSKIYFVLSGQYKDYPMAVEAASSFVNQGIPGAIVVTIPTKKPHAL